MSFDQQITEASQKYAKPKDKQFQYGTAGVGFTVKFRL